VALVFFWRNARNRWERPGALHQFRLKEEEETQNENEKSSFDQDLDEE